MLQVLVEDVKVNSLGERVFDFVRHNNLCIVDELGKLLDEACRTT